jgi:hypothetical protein
MQQDELEMIRCTYSDDLVVKTESPRIEFSIRVLSVAPGPVGTLEEAHVAPDVPYALDLVFVFPEGYPESRALQYSIECNKISRVERDEVLRVANATMALFRGAPCVQAVVEAVRSAVLDVRQEMAEEVVAEELQKAEDRAASEADCNPGDLNWAIAEMCLGRRCVYYHHILSSHKRQCIQRWSRTLRLSGFCKIGYPGILIFEGPEIACGEMVRLLQRLRWKLMVVRGEERLLPGALSVPFEALRAVPHEGVRETADSSEIGDWCRVCGLEPLFKTSMKIYT